MAAHQAPKSLGFSRQEYWSGLPFPSPMHESEKWKWSRSVVSTPSNPMDCSLPGSSVHGIFQARVRSGLPLSSPFIKLSWIKGQAWGWQSAGLGYYFSWSSINGVSQVVQWETIHLPMQEMQEMQFDPWDGKIPWSRNWQSTPVFLPEKSHKKRSRLQSMELKKVRHNWAHTHTELKQMAHLPNSQNKLIQNWFVEWK